MAEGSTPTWSDTHEVTNQPPPLEGCDTYSSNAALVEAVERHGGGANVADLAAIGRRAGDPEWLERGRQANANPPVLRTHDRYGNRLDVVDYHPAYHELMAAAVGAGLHAAPWVDQRPAPHVTRAAGMMTWYQVDAGHTCPISMTYSAVAALRHQPDVADALVAALAAPHYDGSNHPIPAKAGITAGMAMTEKQGGSDVRANTTTARPVGSGGPGAEHLLTGHKWFCSAPMSDGFLVLANAPGGLSCFWMPRWRPDGNRNRVRIQRLKDKLGDRSNASSEIEMLDAWALMVGEEGRGVRTIIEMVNHTRLDCTLGSAGVMRQGVAQATWHAQHRRAFGRVLDEQPLMANVLADLAVESEAATAAAIRVAATFDAADDPDEQRFARLALPIVKYWTCKRAPSHAAEAMECLGGNGFVEDSDLPRVFRQSPVNGIWEGSGNVICLDVLRAMLRSPDSVDAYWDEVDLAGGADRRLDAAAVSLRKELDDLADVESRARRIVEDMALVLQGSLLVRHSPAAVSDAFCASRLDRDAGGHRAFGTLPTGLDLAAIVERHRPAL
ncbi:MAG: acyl-CoA dehydrogenase family protein [Actinobacteria bacterium]|nr:acyl-CoA dehydrogenase family protein [Actinomycetota bacterium]